MRFNLDNPVFTALGKVVDCAWLSILWLLCCLPVVTIGVSSTAMYYTAVSYTHLTLPTVLYGT